MNTNTIAIESLVVVLVAVSLIDIWRKKHSEKGNNLPMTEIRVGLAAVVILFVGVVALLRNASPLFYLGLPLVGLVVLGIVYVMKKRGKNPIH